MLIREFTNYLCPTIKDKEKLLGKVQDFLKFGRHFGACHAGTDLSAPTF
jgi:hypothetical protein